MDPYLVGAGLERDLESGAFRFQLSGAADTDALLREIAAVYDPHLVALFMPAGGVVVNVGGQISHAIIVSRELGLPCVVSVTDATERIPDGALIEVDGTAGTVTVLELAAP